MNTFLVLLGLCEVLIVHVHKAHSQKISLDEYCFQEMQDKTRGDAGFISILKLIHLCSDIESYTNCLKRTREKYVVNNVYKLQDFEKHFPSDDDVERAGYIFCMLTLLLDPYLYNVSPRKVTACKSKVNEAKCEAANEHNSQYLKVAVDNKKPEDVASVSCTMYTSYWTCMRDEYAACSPDMEPMFDYYLARAGASCLQTQKVTNRIIFATLCDGVPVAEPPVPPPIPLTRPPVVPTDPVTQTPVLDSTCPAVEPLTETTTLLPNDGGGSRYDSGCQSPLLVLGVTCVTFSMTTHRGPYDSPFVN